MTVTISVPELHARINDIRLLDVRWRLGAPNGRPAHAEGHLPGAVYVDLESTLAAHPGPGDGRHPLPDRAALQEAVRAWGVNDGDPVVAYDDSGNLAAARAWWLLRDAGLPDVRLLDGGFAAWTAAGHPLETGEVTPQPGTVTLKQGTLPAIDIEAAATWPGVLLDARAGERYRGEVAVYCGSGVTATHTIAALRIAGIDAALYPGSWSQWSSDPNRPVAAGILNPGKALA